MKIELELIDAKTPPKEGVLLLMFIGNVDGRSVTKCYGGYYEDGQWFYFNDTVAKGVTHYASLPEPMDDRQLTEP